jgi:hypothetical protein
MLGINDKICSWINKIAVNNAICDMFFVVNNFILYTFVVVN